MNENSLKKEVYILNFNCMKSNFFYVKKELINKCEEYNQLHEFDLTLEPGCEHRPVQSE